VSETIVIIMVIVMLIMVIIVIIIGLVIEVPKDNVLTEHKYSLMDLTASKALSYSIQ